MKYFRKDWILFQEIANEGGKYPTELLDLKVKTDDPETNKHVPFIIENRDGYTVKCGKNDYHAEDKEHHTVFIELVVDDVYFYKKYIAFGEKPEVHFLAPKGKKVEAFTFCNLHGLWTYQLK